MSLEKSCTKCGESYPATKEFFYSNAQRKDGLNNWCKPCFRQYTKDNAESFNESSRRYRKTAKGRASIKRYQKKNPERKLAHLHNSRARKVGAPGTITPLDLHSLMTRQDGQCVYCGRFIHNNYHVDHITPLVRSGTNYPDNIQLLCPNCNYAKHDLTHEEFSEYLNLLVHRQLHKQEGKSYV